MNKITRDIKRGIALEGGGAKGAFQVGAMKAIRELGIPYEGVVGASIGSINGALIAMDDPSLMETIWLSTKVNDIIAGDPELIRDVVKLDFKKDPAKIRQVLLETIKRGGLDVSPYRDYLRRIIDEEMVRKSPIEYGLVTLSLSDLKPIEVFANDIPEGKLIDYIIASANFPAFKIDKMDDKILLDGGFFDNLPVNMLLERGYDEVIAIRVMGIGRIRKIQKKDMSKVVYIEPSEDLGKTLEIDPVKAKYNMTLGYYDAYRVLKKLRGTRYYITEHWDEGAVFKQLSMLSASFCKKMIKTLGIEAQPPQRFVFEVFMPLLADVLKLPKSATYGEIILALYEELASYAGVERLRFYSLKSLIDQVNRYYIENTDDLTTALNGLSVKLIGFVSTTGLSVISAKYKRNFLEYVLYLLIHSKASSWHVD